MYVLYVYMSGEDDVYVAVWDIETQEAINDMPGRFRDDKIKLLNISCASIVKIPSKLCVDSADREKAMEASTTHTFWIDGVASESMESMVAMLVGAELVVGYNLCGFDWMVAKKYFVSFDEYDACLNKTHDVFSRVRDATGVWYKLDTLLQTNSLTSKTADGLQAIRWWKEGRREVLGEYCEVDTQQCARLSLLPGVNLGGGRRLPNFVFGTASALAALRAL